VAVIDADPGADLATLDLPATVTALTGRPGSKHLYFNHDGPLGNSNGRLGLHIDRVLGVVFQRAVQRGLKAEKMLECHSPGEVLVRAY